MIICFFRALCQKIDTQLTNKRQQFFVAYMITPYDPNI